MALGLSELLSDSMRYPRGVAPCGSAQRIAAEVLQHQKPGILGIPAHHLINKKNDGQSGRGDQGNTGPSVNGDCEADILRSSKGKAADLGMTGNAHKDEGNGINQCLCKECPSRKPRYASRRPARGDLATEKEQHHEVDHGRPPGIYNLCFRKKVAIPQRIVTHK